MASPASTLKKPILTIKRENLFKYTPVILSPLKRALTTTQPSQSAKKTCLEISDQRNIVESSVITDKKPEILVIKEDHPKKELRSNSPSGLFTIAVPIDSGEKFTSNIQVNRCLKHEELPEHKAEGLPQFGDIYNSPEEFYDYTTKNAQNWYFYYVRQDSHNLKTSSQYNKNKATTVVFSCRFNTKKYKSQSKGLRKRSEKQAIFCPAGVNLKCDAGTDVYKVHTVCHHHRHELSAELFKQLPHGYRLPQELKAEIQDLAHFNLDPVIARRYIESKTPGLSLRKSIYNTFVKIRNSQSKNMMSPERVQEMLEKIKYIKANFSDNLPNKPRFTAQKAENSLKMATPRKFAEMQEQKMAQSVNALKSTSEVEENPCEEITQDDFSYNIIAEYEEYQPTEVIVQTSVDESESTGTVKHRSEKLAVTNAPFKDYKIGDVTIKPAATDYNGTVHTYKVLIETKLKQKSDNASMNPTKSEDTIDETITIEESNNITEDVINETAQAKAQSFSTNVKCDKRHDNLPEHKAVGLVKVGDTFSSMEEFARYAAAHSLKWFFYYQVAHSRNVKTTDRYNPKRKTWYNFTCRFNKGWYKSQSTGARKVKQKSIFCPAMVNMTCNPGEEAFRVVYVCHHHSHELSYQVFSQEAHGHRLPPELKDEIRELAWFQLDRRLMRAYLMHKTGFDLRPTIKNVLSKMRRNKEKLIITTEKEKEVLDKIKEIKKNFDIPKRARSTNHRIQNEEDSNYSDSEEEGVASRVEARLNNILHDRELIQSVKELQEITGCEIHIDSGDGRNMSHLQSGLIEETCYDDSHVTDDGDNQIEVDQEVYPMDENVYYIADTTQNGEVLYLQDNISHELANTTQQCENTLYIDKLGEITSENVVIVNREDQDCDDVQYEVHIDEEEVIVKHENITQYDVTDVSTETEYADDNNDIVNNETDESLYQYSDNISYVKNVIECSAVANNVEYNYIESETKYTTVTENYVECKENDFENVYQDANDLNVKNELESTSVDKQYVECNDNESGFQNVYPDASKNIENEMEYTSVNKSKNDCQNEDSGGYYELTNMRESNYCKDIGVQADFEIIGLEEDSEIIKNMESKFLSADLAASNLSVSTRGRPKAILDEGIINKYNIEFYMSIGGVAICIENLSVNMGLSVIELLKKVYQGEAVLKMSSGRSGKVSRKTVQLTYVPVAVSFPLENYKYINVLQEYKSICSKYADLVHKLEETIESMSAELKETKKKVENIGSKESMEVNKNYDDLQKGYKESQLLLKESKEGLSKTQAENNILLDKVNKLESYQLQKVLEPKYIIQKSSEISKQRFSKLEQELHEVSSENVRLVEKIKSLEEAAVESVANIKHYQAKINKLEDLYLTDSQSLLDKIKMLEKELYALVKSGGKPSSSLKEYFEDYKIIENEELTDKIKMLKGKITSLNSQLEEEKNKNLSVKNHNYASKAKK